MPMYNLIEYNENYSDTPRNLQLLKRNEAPVNNADVTIDISTSFKYNSSLVRDTVADGTNEKATIIKKLFQ